VIPNTDLVAELREEHLLTIGAGDNVVRLLPPLNIDESHVAEAVKRIDRACAAIENRMREAAKTAAE
jgi:acetylornithine/N-succinyldiaminopimelate aminotransferase